MAEVRTRSSAHDDRLAAAIRRRREQTPVVAPIPRRDLTAAPLLSYAQERLFALDQIVDSLQAYNQAQAFRLLGPLDRNALERAVHDLQLRHEILRTAVNLDDGQFVLSAGDPTPLAYERAAPDVAASEQALRELVTDHVRRPLILTASGPLRATLVELGPDDHALVVSLHHIACDDVSKRVIFDDLGRLYGVHTGQTPPLPDLALQYADYASWQREQTAGQALEGDLEWWRNYLRGAPAQTSLPLDRPRPAVATNHGAKHRSHVPELVARQLDVVARSLGATRFHVLFAAFAFVLELFGRDGEVVIGSPLSGRDREELRDMVGLFLNTLPVRVETRGDLTFHDLVGRVQRSFVDVLTHQHVPFEAILEAVRPARDASHGPIFQTMFTLRGAQSQNPSFADITVDPIAYDGGWTKFDLGATCLASPSGVDVLWQYNTDLFNEATIRRIATTFGDVLAAAVAQPDAALAELARPSGDELERVVTTWNDTVVTDVPESAVHELFEQQVDRSPQAVAVSDGSRSLTYAELDRRANRLAHELIDRGAAPGDIIAVALRRSVDAEVAVLAILKAGAAFLPIDPGYPPTRIEFQLRDSGALLVLTDRASALSVPLGTERIVVDVPSASIDARPDRRPALPSAPNDLAYVIYTSGSTGQPKGVLCEQGGLVNRLIWMAREYGVGASDVIMQKTPLTFDVSVWEVLLPVVTGAELVMAEPDRHGDPDYLTELIDTRGVTVMHFVPSMLAAFTRSVPTGSCPSLRMIAASGEALTDEIARQCAETLPHVELHNLYGPTEASIDVTAVRFDPADEQSVTIGAPIANMRTYVLDAEHHPVRVGMPGELYLAGVGVARGYLNRPELDTERFLTDPFAGGRMYRTGDRARWRDDGRIVYLGRLDDQVKIRGFRIELGEVEAALTNLEGVAAAACTVRGQGDDARLVGFVVPVSADQPPDLADLRGRLARLLPAFEVPSTLALLDALPLSGNGKLDRRSLPEVEHAETNRQRVAPRDDIERRVADAWAAVLGNVELSVDDNFFDVGGHSLSALRLFSMLERDFRVKVPLSMTVQGVTIADIATYIRDARGNAEQWDLVVPMRPHGDLPPLFVLPGMRGDVLVFRQMLPHLDRRRPILGIQCRGIDGRVPPRTSMPDIARDCIEAMRANQPSGPYHVLGFCFGGLLAYEIGRQLDDAGEAIDFIGIIDKSPPRNSLPSSGFRWRRRLRLITTGGPRRARELVKGFIARYARRLAAAALARAGRRIPPALIDIEYANKTALWTYAPPPADLHLTLIRRVENEAEPPSPGRWAELAGKGLDVIPLDGRGMDHNRIIQSRFADRVADAVNDALAAIPR